MSGDNTDCSINFIPKMNYETLINGYQHILKTIYAPKQYYERVKILLREYKPQKRKTGIIGIKFYHIEAVLKSMWFLGVKEKGRWHYWKLFMVTLLRRPRSFPLVINLSVYGFHFRKVVESYISMPNADTMTIDGAGKQQGISGY
tara:strand:- start:338 stop:772 length:435 start_codon:yes stop_codon:yes gene_type:complete